MEFESWLIQFGKSENTAQKYNQAISGSITTWAKDTGIITGSLLEIETVEQLKKIYQEIKALSLFQKRDSVGKGMYGAALNQYLAYREDLSTQDIKSDIENVLGNSDINTTEKTALVNARVGQGAFRQQLIEYWKGCAVTKYSDTRLLMASHVKPWKFSENQERLDIFNGLLLLPNIDKAFDRGFVTFKKNGNILISHELVQADKLGVVPEMRVALCTEHQTYMAYHRDKVFERWLKC